MSVSLPVIVGAGAVIVALVCIGICARRRRVRADGPRTEAVEAVFVQDIPSELEPFVGAPEPQPAAAQVYPVHKLVQAVADGPITFGPTRQEAKPPAPVREPSLPEPEPELELVVEPLKVVPFDQETEDAPAPLAPRLEVVPDPQPEVAPEPEVTVPEPQLQPVAPIMAREPVIDLPVEPQPEPAPAPVPEPAVAQPAPAAEVVMLTAQIEVLSETIARLTDRIEAVAAAATSIPATQPEAEPEPEVELDVEPDFMPDAFVARTAEPELDEFALEVELEPEPHAEPEPEAITRPERSPRPPLTRRPAAESTTYERRRVDDDLLAWPSDEELERYSGRQGRRDA